MEKRLVKLLGVYTIVILLMLVSNKKPGKEANGIPAHTVIRQAY